MHRVCAAMVGAVVVIGAAEAGIVHTVPAAPITATAMVPNGQASSETPTPAPQGRPIRMLTSHTEYSSCTMPGAVRAD